MPLMTLPEAEKRQILAALEVTNWRIYGPRGAARLLGIGPEKLRYRMRKYGLETTRESVPVRACSEDHGSEVRHKV